MRTCTGWIVLALASVALADADSGARVGSGGRGPPNPFPTSYRFENDVLVEMSEDQNRDKRPDAWWFYDRGRLARFEQDTDHDGKPDWRETWREDEYIWSRELTTQQLDGRWRILASAWRPDRERTIFTGRAEKWVGGAWVDTFDDRRERSYEQDETTTRRWTETWRFENGKPVEFRTAGRHKLWKDGRISFSEDKSDSRWLVARYQPNGDFETLDQTPDGKPIARWSVKSGVLRNEEWRDGKWLDTYTAESKGQQAHERKVYERGRQVLFEQVEAGTGVVLRRYRWAADGGWVDEQMERDGSPHLRTTVDPLGTRTRTEQIVEGKWTGDFVQDGHHARHTYRAGRLVRIEDKAAAADDPMKVRSYPNADHEEWADAKVTRRWLTYAPREPGRVRRLIREARDLDEDGVPDLKVDYETLTIVQP